MRALVEKLLARLRGPGFAAQFWDGTVRHFGDGPERFRIGFRSWGAALALLLNPDMGFGEGYMDGSITVEGDLDALLELARANSRRLSGSVPVRLWRALLQALPVNHRRRRDIAHHYDLGNDFFTLWLDPTLTYSCAYFRTPDESLHEAQLRKIEHTLCKLNLQPGQRLLDIGCGWGWLIITAAQRYGVHATGITLSKEQFDACQERIARLGLSDRVVVRLQDFRELGRTGEQFDRVVSVGMFEHVGRAHINQFIRTLRRLIRPGGLGLLHSITQLREEPISPWIRRYIFPGGYIPSWRETIGALAGEDLRLLDAEDLRTHYARTLDHWSAGFEAVREHVAAQYGEQFVRMWRLYLRCSAVAFWQGGLHIHQFLISNGVATEHPLTREYLYSG